MLRAIPIVGLAFLFALPVHADTPEAKPVTVPFELLKTKHMAVMVKINGKGPYRLIFDTGAPVNLISNKVGKETGLIAKDADQPAVPLLGPLGQARIKTLEIGALKVEDTPAMVADHPTVALLAKAVGPIEGIVGLPFFGRFHMTIDYQAKQMTFVPNDYKPADLIQSLMTKLTAGNKAGPRILVPAAQWGMSVDKEAKDEEAGVVIKEVLADGAAAEAGLKPGDRLLSLDGRWTDSVADCYQAAGFVKVGIEVPVVIKRGDKEVQLKVKPRPGM